MPWPSETSYIIHFPTVQGIIYLLTSVTSVVFSERSSRSSDSGGPPKSIDGPFAAQSN